MKYVALLLVLLLTQRPLLAQSCHQVQVATTAQQKELLREYLKECYRKRFFFEDKGVVKLTIFQDSAGLTNWHLSALIDDRYRSRPPEQYAFFDDYIILVYKGDQDGFELPIAGDNTSRNACIEDVVGSRVYERSNKKQFVYKPDATGKVQKVPITYISYGNKSNEIIIRFNRDGTITKFLPV